MRPAHAPSPDAIRLRPVAPLHYFRERIAAMHPAYFAFVMATGIVAIGAHLLGLHGIASLLARVNAFAYPGLCLLFIARAALFPDRVWADCMSHQRAPGYFTVVAATSVIGVQFALLFNDPEQARALWWATVALWILTTYGIFALLITQPGKPTLAGGINGGWLVAVVATQSVVVLGAVIAPPLPNAAEQSYLVLLSFWMCGGVLYLWIISLIFYRYFFFDFSPTDLMPPYWINMGAMAISTLAGALLCARAPESPLLTSMAPVLKGITLAYWATATWWIPMLFLLGIWRHGVKRFPLDYDPLYWGMVFPFGMYAVCTFRLGNALDIPWLLPLARLFFVVAIVAWISTFLGLSRRLLFGLVLTLRNLKAFRNNATAVPDTKPSKEIEHHVYHPYPRL